MLIIKQFKNINNTVSKDYLIARTKWEARKNLALYKWKTQDKLLNAYLKTNYKTTLLHTCLKIILNAKLSHNSSATNEIIIVIPDKQLDNLAGLITYGDCRVPGSNILRKIFS